MMVWWSSHNHESEVRLNHGHVIDVLRALPEQSVHCVVTSPPYWGLRDYGLPPSVWGGDPACNHEWGEWLDLHDVREETVAGKSRTTDRCYGDPSRRFNGNHQKHAHGAFCRKCGAWLGCLGLEPDLNLYVAHMAQVFREVRRVLRADGTLWLNLGDCYGSGTRATRDYSRGTKHGYWNNPAIDKRIPAPAKQLLGIPWRVALALQEDGWWLRSDIVWDKPNAMPESVSDRPTRSHEYLFLLSRSARYYYDAEAIREPYSEDSLARVQRGRSATHKWADGGPSGQTLARDISGGCPHPKGRNKRSVWTIPTQGFADGHFATFPERLVAPCVMAGAAPMTCPKCGAPWRRVVEEKVTGTRHVSPKDANPHRKDGPHSASARLHSQYLRYDQETVGWRPTCSCDGNDGSGRAVVLDPFVGAGTTVVVAQRLGRHGWGIDLSEEYLAMAKNRIEREHRQMRLPVPPALNGSRGAESPGFSRGVYDCFPLAAARGEPARESG